MVLQGRPDARNLNAAWLQWRFEKRVVRCKADFAAARPTPTTPGGCASVRPEAGNALHASRKRLNGGAGALRRVQPPSFCEPISEGLIVRDLPGKLCVPFGEGVARVGVQRAGKRRRDDAGPQVN